MLFSSEAALVPEAQSGGWDLAYICEFTPWYFDLFVFWLVGTVLTTAIITMRIHRRSPRGISTFLEELFMLFKNREFSAVVERARSLPALSLDSEFIQIAELGASPSPIAIQSVVRMANAGFLYRLQRLRAQASILPTLLGLAVVATLFYLGFAIASVFWATRAAKVTPLNAIAPGIAEIILEAGWGLFVVTFVFVLHRYLSRRLENGRIAWEYFVGRVMALEYMIGAEKQPEKASNQL